MAGPETVLEVENAWCWWCLGCVACGGCVAGSQAAVATGYQGKETCA